MSPKGKKPAAAKAVKAPDPVADAAKVQQRFPPGTRADPRIPRRRWKLKELLGDRDLAELNAEQLADAAHALHSAGLGLDDLIPATKAKAGKGTTGTDATGNVTGTQYREAFRRILAGDLPA